MSREVADEYLSSLADLTVNSKPLINMLTMLADENVDHAPAIVQVIENHIEKVAPEIKLPILYLIDSIIKNVSRVYVPLFTQNIVNIFVSVFERVDEKTRLNMYKLRQTWGDVFPARKLYVLDLRVKDIDHAWPVTAPTPTIHFNPKFLGNKTNIADVSSSPATTTAKNTNTTPAVPIVTSSSDVSEKVLRDQLLNKQKILIQLQQTKLELELMHTKVILEEQEKHANDSNSLAGLVRPPLTDDSGKLSQRSNAKSKTPIMPPPAGSNSKSIKTKIAPANTQIIEAVKSRDPRIARQQLQQSKTSEITHKEQEIYNRQLAMLKTPVVEQVVPVTPVQRVLSESNVKGHITINIERNRDREKLDGRTKKQVRDNGKTESPPSKNKFKSLQSQDSRSSPSRNPKSGANLSKDSKNCVKSAHANSSSGDKLKTPSKNERSVSPGISRHCSPKSDSKWSKHSGRKHSRTYSSPKKSKNYNGSSPKGRRGGGGGGGGSSKSGSSSPKVRPSYSQDVAAADSPASDKNRRKSRKRHKKGDSENACKYFDSSSDKSMPDYSSLSRKDKSGSYVEERSICDSVADCKIEDKSEHEGGVRRGDDGLRREESKSSAVERSEKAEEGEGGVESGLGLGESSSRNTSSKSDHLEHPEKMVKSEGLLGEEKCVEKLRYTNARLVESSPSPEPPPPPIISRSEEDVAADKRDEMDFNELSDEEKECKKERTGFKDLKGVSKGRNYMRRNREASVSPQKEAAGDVDLRISAPPEKQPRLCFEDEKIAENEIT